ncbi:protein-serine O-palmitoleoyltransferase porcupine isoform X2 [Venturia canescens]|uniref:protein-serine O-palmitoleoyltransferase porcupine isoform X2 n=1 Tax=Venturia canescens TaxID=32260 RepID=UPI001C9C449B|nr:protein-serine O-palmitoleoyltransferase porcupine isoform X2 [Venturia canescens]
MDEPASDSFFLYDDDDDEDCEDCDHLQMTEYDEYYDELPAQSFTDIYNYCLTPSIHETAKYFYPLVLSALLFRILAQNRYTPPRIFHGLSTLIGLWVIQHYVKECFYLLLYFVAASYACLYLPKVFRGGIKTFLPSLIIILHCEWSLDPVDWHKVRSVIMIASMRTISLASDVKLKEEIPSILEYTGYVYGAATALFGPWISFKDYTALQNLHNQWWILTDHAGKWFLAYRDALAFRSSHYFIAHATSSILILGGYPLSEITIVKPLEIELPRSLVQVVVSWNIPMHTWLKLYIFRPARRRLGKFSAVVLTYFASSLLHGLNFQLAAVLLSLGFYTFIEYQLRNVLAETFDACIAAKKCPVDKCPHAKKSTNCLWVILTNLGFSVLTMFHLAYLGLMFDTSEIQETGYSYEHTIRKWSQLGFASHWVAFATYIIYFLIR